MCQTSGYTCGCTRPAPSFRDEEADVQSGSESQVICLEWPTGEHRRLARQQDRVTVECYSLARSFPLLPERGRGRLWLLLCREKWCLLSWCPGSWKRCMPFRTPTEPQASGFPLPKSPLGSSVKSFPAPKTLLLPPHFPDFSLFLLFQSPRSGFLSPPMSQPLPRTQGDDSQWVLLSPSGPRQMVLLHPWLQGWGIPSPPVPSLACSVVPSLPVTVPSPWGRTRPFSLHSTPHNSPGAPQTHGASELPEGPLLPDLHPRSASRCSSLEGFQPLSGHLHRDTRETPHLSQGSCLSEWLQPRTLLGLLIPPSS